MRMRWNIHVSLSSAPLYLAWSQSNSPGWETVRWYRPTQTSMSKLTKMCPHWPLPTFPVHFLQILLLAMPPTSLVLIVIVSPSMCQVMLAWLFWMWISLMRFQSFKRIEIARSSQIHLFFFESHVAAPLARCLSQIFEIFGNTFAALVCGFVSVCWSSLHLISRISSLAFWVTMLHSRLLFVTICVFIQPQLIISRQGENSF